VAWGGGSTVAEGNGAAGCIWILLFYSFPKLLCGAILKILAWNRFKNRFECQNWSLAANFKCA